KESKALVEEQDVQIGLSACLLCLCRVQKPCKGETVATDGRDGLDDRSRGSRATGDRRHKVMQGRCPVAWIRVEVLGVGFCSYGIARHHGKGFGKADALVLRA